MSETNKAGSDAIDPVVGEVLADPGPELPRLRFAALLKAAGRPTSAARVATNPAAAWRLAVGMTVATIAEHELRALAALQAAIAADQWPDMERHLRDAIAALTMSTAATEAVTKTFA